MAIIATVDFGWFRYTPLSVVPWSQPPVSIHRCSTCRHWVPSSKWPSVTLQCAASDTNEYRTCSRTSQLARPNRPIESDQTSRWVMPSTKQNMFWIHLNPVYQLVHEQPVLQNMVSTFTRSFWGCAWHTHAHAILESACHGPGCAWIKKWSIAATTQTICWLAGYHSDSFWIRLFHFSSHHFATWIYLIYQAVWIY